MIVAIVSLLSLTLGCLITVICQLALIAFHLGDMKAYTMTHTDLLKELSRTRKLLPQQPSVSPPSLARC